MSAASDPAGVEQDRRAQDRRAQHRRGQDRGDGLWESRTLRRSLLGHNVALAVAGLGWVGLLLWQVLLAISVHQARGEVERCEAWLQKSAVFQQRIYHFAAQLSSALSAGRPAPRMPSALAGQEELLVGLPSAGEEVGIVRRRLSQAMEELGTKAKSLIESPRERARIAACLQPAVLVSAETSALSQLVRKDLRAHSVNLDEHWSHLFRLSAGLFAAIAILMWLLARSKKRVRDLAAAKHAFQMSESRLRSLLKMQLGFAWSINSSGRWSYLSEGAREIYGREPKEMVGRPVVEFVLMGRVEQERRFFARVIAAEGAVLEETVHLNANGERVALLLEAKAMRDHSGYVTGITGVAVDVTALHEMREHQAHAERLEAIQTLAEGVAHDFNNLLGVIRSSNEFACEAMTEQPQLAAAALSDAGIATERAEILIKQLQDFARHQDPAHTTSDLAAVVRRTKPLMLCLLGPEIVLRCVVPAKPLFVRADQGQIERVLLNLLMNARDAGGSTITVEASRRRVGSSEAKAAGIEQGDWAVVLVSDDGEGMDADTQRRAFEPFFTTRRPSGSGLGLAVVHGIVRAQRGGIELMSASGVGTSCRIYLREEPLGATQETVAALAHES